MKLFNDPLIKKRFAEVKSRISGLKVVPSNVPLGTEESLDAQEIERLKEIDRIQKIENTRQLKAYNKYEKALVNLEKGSQVYKNKFRKQMVIK
jgi:hypothetical protein